MTPCFSRRLPWEQPENALARLEARLRSEDRSWLDLTVTNPTAVGLPYPEADIAAALADRRVASYQPEPFGLPAARAAVAADYARRGVAVDAEAIVITASSSESYAFLFKLLADPGDAVLVPEPSYSLFEHLARLEGLVVRPYRLSFDGRWRIDRDSVDAEGARAFCLVNPNNPTGSFLLDDDLAWIESLAASRGIALVVDEVFADYRFEPPADAVLCAAVGPRATLTFCLGGLSKAVGLPQMKLGWIAALGPEQAVREALACLGLIADTYLSVGTAVQVGVPRLFALGADIRERIRARVRTNLAHLRAAVGPNSPCTLLPVEGGWSALLRVPALMNDEDWALRLLEYDGVLVQPGYFFDLRPGAILVLSLLQPPEIFAEGTRRILARAAICA